MSYENPPEKEPSPRRLTPRQKFLLAHFGATIAVGSVIGFTTVKYHENQATDARAAADILAMERNTCSIRNAELAQRHGRPVLQVTIDLVPRLDPAQIDKSFGVWSKATYSDENDFQGGVVMDNMDTGESTWTNIPGDGPDTATNKGYIELLGGPVDGTYEVWRRNAVTVNITGPLVVDEQAVGVAEVYCGTFSYTYPR